MSYIQKVFEDKRIIGTHRYQNFQKLCSEAGHIAAKEARARGLPLTYVENNHIIKEYADGNKEVLGEVKPDIKMRRIYTIP